MALPHATRKRWTLEEYQRLADCGGFQRGEHIELIDGEIVTMPAQGTAHWRTIVKATKRLVHAFGDTHEIGVQGPYPIPKWHAPEPDFLIVPSAAFFSDRTGLLIADLIIEVSDSSLDYDRYEKASLYASAGVPEYWILNLPERQLECHLEPVSRKSQPFGFMYRQRVLYPESSTVAARFRPDVKLQVGDLLD